VNRLPLTVAEAEVILKLQEALERSSPGLGFTAQHAQTWSEMKIAAHERLALWHKIGTERQ